MSKSWAERHPIITGALVGSIVPGIGTLAGAFAGVIYDVVEKNTRDEEPTPPPQQSRVGVPIEGEEESES